MDSNAIHHPSPAINMKCLFLDYIQLLMIGHAGWCTRTPFATSLQPKKWNAHFWITFNSWWSTRLVDGLEPHLPPLSSHKNEMLIFRLHSTSDDQPGWSMDSNPICHPSPAKKMKCSFLDYVQLLMIGQTGWWMRTPSTTHLQPRKWNVHFWVMFNFWWSARLVDGLKPHLPPISSQKHEMLVFGLHSTPDDQPGWSMDSNPICNPYPAKKNEMLIFGLHSTSDDKLDWSMDSNAIHHPSPAKNMKCSFLDYIQRLMIGQAGRWTWTSSTTSLQPKKWNAHFWIMFNFWWLAGLVDGLKPHLQPLSSQKKLNAHFLITFNFWWLLGLINWLKPHPPPLSTQKNEMPIFTLHSNSDDKPGWSMDSNSICHPSPAKKIQCSFLEYVQLLMIGQAGWWTQTPSATPLQPKKWNPHFWNTFNFWWSTRLVDGLEPHLPPLSSQKHEILIFGLCSTSDDWPGWSMDCSPVCHLSAAKKMKCPFSDYIQLLMISRAGQWTRTPSATPLQPKKWNAHFWIMFNFWWSGGLVDRLEPHLWPLSSHKNEMLIFGLRSTSDDQLDWSMDSNAIHHPSPAINMKCLFLDYIQLLMIGQAGRCTRTSSTTSIQPQKWNAHFWITFNSWWLAGLVDGLKPHLSPLSSHKNEMLIFGLRSTSDDQLDWSLDSNAIHHPSPAKNMKCLFLDNVQLLMICQGGRWTWAPSATPLQPKKMKCSFLDNVQLLMISPAGQWTQIPSATSLQPKKWNAHFWIMFNFWWSARLVNGLKSHLPPLSSQKNEMLIFGLCSTSDDQIGWSMDSNPFCNLSPAKKMKCSFLDYVQLLMIGQTGWWTWTPSTTHLQPRKWNAHFWVMFNFWWSARLVNGLEPHLSPLSSQKHEMFVFGLHSTSDDQPGWSMDSNSICNPYPAKKNEMLIFGLHSTSDDQLDWSMDSNAIHHPSPAINMKCLFLDYIQLLMIGQAGRCTRTQFATSLQPKKWNAHFWITFNSWWSAGLVDGLEPHLPPLSSHKNEMPIFGLRSTSDDWPC